jgi:glycosyltransferase involved in cell wall biosynthesis
MKLSIITPTIGRTTLARTCKAIDEQGYEDWEHIIIYDGLSSDQQFGQLIAQYANAKRVVTATESRCNDFGHTPRQIAWDYVAGEYIGYIDDDDYYLPGAFERIAEKLAMAQPDLLIFPADRMGQRFMNIPPGHARTVSCQYFHKKIAKNGEPIRFSGGQYGHDGEWIEEVIAKHGFSWVDGPELVYVSQIGEGRMS